MFDHLDVIVRAAKTFVATFLAAWALTNNQTTKVALISAFSAGVTAVWNYSLQVYRGAL